MKPEYDVDKEDHFVSLLHLENLSNIRRIIKTQSYNYQALEEYLYSDRIADGSSTLSESGENQMEADPS